MMQSRRKLIISLGVFVGLALMAGVVYAGRWISVGDAQFVFSLDKACTDGFRVTGAFRPELDIYTYPTGPTGFSLYARLYPERLEPFSFDKMEIDPFNPSAPPELTPVTPRLADASITLMKQPTSIVIDSLNDNAYNITTDYWGTKDIPWTTPVLGGNYPVVAVFREAADEFKFIGDFTAIENCTLFGLNAVDDNLSTRRNRPLFVSSNLITANDTSSGGKAFSIVSATLPKHGRLIKTGALTGWYIPNLGFTGKDTIVYTIKDVSGATDTATITIDVRP